MAIRVTAPTSHALRSHEIRIEPESKSLPLVWDTQYKEKNLTTIDSIDNTYNPHKLGPLKQLLKVDLLESSTEYYLAADLPGISKDCIEIGVEEDCIVLRAERKKSNTDRNIRYHVMERNNGKLERFIRIPADSDTRNIVADFSLGHLEIIIPKIMSVIGPVRVPIRFK